jgi:hypothetical protein
MTNRFYNPFGQHFSSTPSPLSGAKLFFYAAGTSTKLDTYSDTGLSVANSNPVVLNSSGRPDVDIYLSDAAYKVVLAPSTDSDPPTSPIWTADNYYIPPVNARVRSGAGSPNGSVAGTAGSSTVAASVYWDTTNNILYVCTTTGTSSTAVWTAVNASTAAAVVPPPQGYLTPTSGPPIIATDATAQTAVYYTPLNGVLVPIYNGSSFTPTVFSELTLTLASQHVADTIYDVFAFSNTGVVTLATGPAWNTSTAGSGARGTGAGTTQISKINGLWVNTVSMTGRNGSTTYTIGANRGTYLGSLLIDGTNGQVTCHRGYGQTRRWAIWNAYNRQPLVLRAGDSTASWTYNSGTYRASNNATANVAKLFCGLAEEQASAQFVQKVGVESNNANQDGTANNAIGLNSSSSVASNCRRGSVSLDVGSSGDTHRVRTNAAALLTVTPGIGLNNIFCLEGNDTPPNATTWFGTQDHMEMIVRWNG